MLSVLFADKAWRVPFYTFDYVNLRKSKSPSPMQQRCSEFEKKMWTKLLATNSCGNALEKIASHC